MDGRKTENTVWHPSAISRDDRFAATGSAGVTIWLTGLSGSGKSSVAVELEKLCIENRRPAYLLDGDNLRHGLNGDLGFADDDRKENIRRVAHVASLFADAGVTAIAPLVSPFAEARNAARKLHETAGLQFVEVFVDTPLEVCEARDVKGLYAKARAGEITGMTGIDSPFEAPQHPDMRFVPEDGSAAEVAAKILAKIS